MAGECAYICEEGWVHANSEGVMSPGWATTLSTCKAMVNSAPVAIDLTSIERSTPVREVDGELIPKGMKIDCPRVTDVRPSQQTGELATSDALDVIWAFRGRSSADSQVMVKAYSVPLNLAEATLA
jgi:hypothetical protein